MKPPRFKYSGRRLRSWAEIVLPNACGSPSPAALSSTPQYRTNSEKLMGNSSRESERPRNSLANPVDSIFEDEPVT